MKQAAIDKQIKDGKDMQRDVEENALELVKMQSDEAANKKAMIEEGSAKITKADQRFREESHEEAQKLLRSNLQVTMSRVAKAMLSAEEEQHTARIVNRLQKAAYEKALAAKDFAQQAVQLQISRRNATADVPRMKSTVLTSLGPITYPSGRNASAIRQESLALPRVLSSVYKARARLIGNNETKQLKQAIGKDIEQQMITQVTDAESETLRLARRGAAEAKSFLANVLSQKWYDNWLRNESKRKENLADKARLITQLQWIHEDMKDDADFDVAKMQKRAEEKIVRALSHPIQHLAQERAEAVGKDELEYSMNLASTIMAQRVEEHYLRLCDIHEMKVRTAMTSLAPTSAPTAPQQSI